MKTYQILCIDDDEQFLSSLESALPSKVESLCTAYQCAFDFVTTHQEAFEVLASAQARNILPAMLISDQVMPGMNGIDLIEKVKAIYPDIVCVLLTGHSGLESAKYAINRHLLDQYVSKPIDDIHGFATLVANLLRGHHLCLEERERSLQLAVTVEELRASNDRIQTMQLAAEQVAMLAKGLKCLNLGEVVNLVTHEVPKMFKAERSVLCFLEGLPDQCGPFATILQSNCPAAEDVVMNRVNAKEAGENSNVMTCDAPCACQNLGGCSPSLIIPLRLHHPDGTSGNVEIEQHAYMCLCGIDKHVLASPELVLYIGGLVRDVLGANLANAVLYSITLARSETDSLTGACTRRVLEAKLDAEYQRAQRYGNSFCAVIVDVNGFKLVNDQYGHSIGDRVLRELAEVMRSEMRSCDTLARYGGDEFVWLMPETTASAAVEAVERLKKSLECRPVADGPRVTVSGGISEWLGSPDDTPDKVIRRADAAMYKAKHLGGNSFEQYEQPSVTAV